MYRNISQNKSAVNTTVFFGQHWVKTIPNVRGSFKKNVCLAILTHIIPVMIHMIKKLLNCQLKIKSLQMTRLIDKYKIKSYFSYQTNKILQYQHHVEKSLSSTQFYLPARSYICILLRLCISVTIK